MATMTEEEFRDGVTDHMGICLACGESQGGCEPDAKNYKCEACGEHKVMGYEWALIGGDIEITEEEEE